MQYFKDSKHTALLKEIALNFKCELYGDHGMAHWHRVYLNTQKLAKHYGIESEVFELFSILHDSKRENEYIDPLHGPRAAIYAKNLIINNTIHLSEKDSERLIYACHNHTTASNKNEEINDLIIKICIDSDRLDLGRVGITPNPKYLFTDFGKKLASEMMEL